MWRRGSSERGRGDREAPDWRHDCFSLVVVDSLGGEDSLRGEASIYGDGEASLNGKGEQASLSGKEEASLSGEEVSNDSFKLVLALSKESRP